MANRSSLSSLSNIYLFSSGDRAYICSNKIILIGVVSPEKDGKCSKKVPFLVLAVCTRPEYTFISGISCKIYIKGSVSLVQAETIKLCISYDKQEIVPTMNSY